MTITNPTTEAMRLSGIMADAAIRLVGGIGLNSTHQGANMLNMAQRAEDLRTATEDYNAHILKWHIRE